MTDVVSATLDFCSRFIWCSVWGRIWNDSCKGKVLSVPHNTDTKWYLKTWISFSAIFRLWSWGGTSWYLIPFFSITSLNYSEHSLFSKCNFGCMHFSFNRSINFWYNLIISPDVLFCIGSLKMLYLSSSNSTIIYLFPHNDVTGNLPVWSEYILRSNSLCKLYSLAYTTFYFYFVSVDTSLLISVANNFFVDRSPDLILCLCPFHISSESRKYFATAVASSPGQDE